MVPVSGGARARERRLSPAASTVALTVGMAAATAVLLVALVPDLPAPQVVRAPPWWALVPLFVLGERFVVNLRVGRSAFSASFGHVPLVLALCLLPPVEAVAASLTGMAATQVLHLRLRGLKLVFNAGLWSLEATLATTCYALLAGGAPADGARSLAAALAAVVVTNQVTALAVTAVISFHEGFDAAALRESQTLPLLIALAHTSLGALAVVLLQRAPAGLPLLAVLLAGLVLAHRAHEHLHDAHARLERHHGVAQSLARAQGAESVVAAVLEQARELLEVERAELHLAGAVHPAGPPIAATTWWLGAVAAHGGPVLLGADLDERAVLRAAGVADAAAAPLSVSGEPAVLVVADRLGEVSTLGREDLRTLETLANQAGVALENASMVDRLRREAAERAHEARHDALTGLANRRSFLETLDVALAAGSPAGVVLLDLDRFKDVNDALGHTVGDEVLVEVARRLVAAVEPDAVVARLGGDEYAVLVTGAAAPHAVAETALDVARALVEPLLAHGVEIRLEASAGSATAPADGSEAATLLQRADVAMYRAKAERSGHEEYVASLDGSSAERLNLYGELRRAVTGGELDVHFQPSVDPATGAVVSAEALVRWNHPVRGLVPPDAFVPLAERSGLIAPLTELVLARSFAELARWRAAGLLARVAVNLSPRVLLDVTLPARVETMLAAAGLPAGAVTLEVTESAVMTDPDKALAVLTALNALGVHLSVDDYGTGYSSLSYLVRLPVHEVKIDRSFVTGMVAPDGALTPEATIVRSTVEMAHALGLAVVAEGVEDAATLELLGRWGCDAAQGYHMSRPLPVERMDAWLAERAGSTVR